MAGSKLHYAIQSLIEIERHSRRGPIGTREIADAAGLSKRYLEQVFGLLKRAGIVRSSRGKYGGYELELDPESLSVEAIWKAVNEDIAISVNKPDPNHAESRTAHELQSGLHEAAVKFLRSLTLRDMIDLESDESEMFYI